MKGILNLLTAVLLAAACVCTTALADPAVHLACHRTAGGTYWTTLSLTIDVGAKTVDADGVYVLPETVEFTEKTVTWSVMRGYFVFDRKSGRLDWDVTAEYAYLEAIGQPSNEPEANFKGAMHCAAGGDIKPKT